MKRTIVVTALLAIVLTACGQKAVEKEAEVTTKAAEPVAIAPVATDAVPAAAPTDTAVAPAAAEEKK